MKLMKKVRLNTRLLSAALLISANSFAADVTVHNNDFDALTLGDGDSSPIVHNWEITSGAAGIHNPTSHLFVGEEGAGKHDNTLYMIDNSTVSQTLTFHALEFGTYDLSFDVGQRIDMAAQNYSIKVTAGDETLLWATNPDLPATPGSFQHVALQFTTDALPDANLTVEIVTEGTGHLHFDNVALTFQQSNEITSKYYRTVGRYILTTNYETSTRECTPLYSLKRADGTPMVNAQCQCLDSGAAWVGSKTTYDGAVNKRYFECIKQSNN